MDFCCQGGKTLEEACEKKGLDVSFVSMLLEEADGGKESQGPNPAELSPADLCQYIVDTHHAFLRSELPRLLSMAQRVAHVHGGHTPSLVTVFDVVSALADDLYDHMGKEEDILFPAVKASAGSAAVAVPIACLVEEHESAGAALARLNELTSGYNPPADACNTYRALFAGLQDLEEDMHTHVHLENSVLFPQLSAG